MDERKQCWRWGVRRPAIAQIGVRSEQDWGCKGMDLEILLGETE